MSIVLLTGNEIRHKYFRKSIIDNPKVNVLCCICESDSESLKQRIDNDKNASLLQKFHIDARTQSEIDFFDNLNFENEDNIFLVNKGSINENEVVNKILSYKPELLVCYGSSIIKSSLINNYKGKFINIHLGLSPYYRGSGSNIWPLVNSDPSMIGATFMHIDNGIDTGKIIHQIRADIFLGDSPHTIGNRLIKKVCKVLINIIENFNDLSVEKQIEDKGTLYLRKDFDSEACKALYNNIANGLINSYVMHKKHENLKYIVQNQRLASLKL